MTLRKHFLTGLALATGLASTAVTAQTYKVVRPDGRIEYTDRPPANAQRTQRLGEAAPANQDELLPFELRQVVARYPVTFYTTNNCPPCDSGRALLRLRGVPYTEKTVTTGDDSAALQRAEGVQSLPVLRIGAQQVQGFDTGEWNGYLDAAGYPAQSKLPTAFKFRDPTPLVARETQRVAAKPAAASAPAAATPGNAPQGPDPSNPTGIRF